jgi:integrase
MQLIVMFRHSPSIFSFVARVTGLRPLEVHCFFYDHNGKRVKKSTRCTDKKAAETRAREWERDAADPDSARKKRATLEDALTLLIKDREEQAKAGKRSPDTVLFYRRKAGQLLRYFEHGGLGKNPRTPFPLAEMDAEKVDAYISFRRGEGTSENTISKELTCLGASLKLAKRRKLWDEDIDAVMPSNFSTEYKPVERCLTPEELQKLLAQLTPDRSARCAFMVATSACWRETELALREDTSAAQVFLRGTKRSSRRRTVPIVLEFQKTLMTHALKHAEGQSPELFVPWQNVRRDIQAACERAKIASCSPNDLRRTCATWMRALGVSIELVAPVLGHKDTRMVARVYGRMTPEDLAARIYADATNFGSEKKSDNSRTVPVESSVLYGAAGNLEGPEHKSKNPVSGGPETGFLGLPRDGVEPPTRGFSVPKLKCANPRTQRLGGSLRDATVPEACQEVPLRIVRPR